MAPEPQTVLGKLTEAAIFLVVVVDSGGEDGVRELLADVSGLKRSVGFRIPEGELSCVTGIGAGLWDRVFGPTAVPRPAGLHRFNPVAGSKHHAPSTPGDLLFHIRAHRLDLCFELAQRLCERLAPFARVVDEVHGFRSFDERDLLGFVDGTENPEGDAAPRAVTIGADDPAFAGGSYVIVQKYVHDLAAWDALPVEEQERAVGRTKLSDLELPDDVKPANSHVALNTIVDEHGDERQIVRFNMPFGAGGGRRVRHLLHRLRRQPRRDRADARPTCSSATRPATTIGSSTSRPPSPAASSSSRRSISSTIHRPPRTPPRSRRRSPPATATRTATDRSGSAA